MGSKDTRLVLYSFPYSICSIMVGYSFACRGNPGDPSKTVELDIKDIDIMHGQQFDEHYLCDVNNNGEVPVLIKEDGTPMPESVDITMYLADFYPSLAPPEYRAEIEKRLKEMHSISFFALTFGGQPQTQLEARRVLREKLEGDISPQYREAIEHKIKRIEDKKLGYSNDEQIDASIERTKSYMQEIVALLEQSESDWCFGLKQPSALDAHLVVFVARLQDLRRDNLIPDRVRQYADRAMNGQQWRGYMQGRRTRPGV